MLTYQVTKTLQPMRIKEIVFHGLCTVAAAVILTVCYLAFAVWPLIHARLFLSVALVAQAILALALLFCLWRAGVLWLRLSLPIEWSYAFSTDTAVTPSIRRWRRLAVYAFIALFANMLFVALLL